MDRDAPLSRERFVGTWQRVGGDAGEHAFETLVASYVSGPPRAYHNLSHIRDCLAWFDRARELAGHPDELELALVFHDAVYEPMARDNEARSAELFSELARADGLALASIARVERLIRSTADHLGESDDEHLMGDIDLAILGAAPAAFARFERGIRREYRGVDDVRYRAGRRRVLSGFLARESIYRTRFFAIRLERPARENIARALAIL